jgi:DNA adenine methylase
VRLRDLARRLKQRGVHVLVSNSSAQAVRELYRDGFQLARISARRAIAARVTERGPIGELLIR